MTSGTANSDMKIVSIPMLLGVPEAMSTAESVYGFTVTTHNKNPIIKIPSNIITAQCVMAPAIS